ncbi:hypothetical protein GOBAR_AA14340 [Gossypium barbadense]|uniref:Uncharacterized protein n=1 Tax=Gossypium barbadense TaxID=3634 RepID=A0A2P5XSG0_GOSBA|nr:hypothetical protein GOBAR_AA14340 [Gossypium barbadense]
MKIDGECLIELIESCRNKVQVYRSVRMPQLHTSLHFYLTPIGSRNTRALILGWAYNLDAFSSYPLYTWLPSVYRGHDNWYPSLSRSSRTKESPLNALMPTLDMDRPISRLAKSRHEGAKPSRRCELLGKISLLSLEWVLQSSFLLPLHLRTNLRPAQGNLCMPPLPFGSPTPHRNYLPEIVIWPVGPDTRSPTSLTFRYWVGVSPHTWSYNFVETCVFGKQSPKPGHYDPFCEEAPLLPKLHSYFSEFLRDSYLAPLVPGTRTLAWGIFSTPSYPEKVRAPCILESIIVFRALTHPLWMNLAEEPLGFRGIGFSPMFALLKLTFPLLLHLLPLTRVLPPKTERSPTNAFLHPAALADHLAPFIFSVKVLDQ